MCKKPTRSTQPCIPPGSLNRVPASAGVRAGMSPVPGGRQGCSGAGTRWNAVTANILEPERRSGKDRWPQVER